jgi:hypothetical protein
MSVGFGADGFNQSITNYIPSHLMSYFTELFPASYSGAGEGAATTETE